MTALIDINGYISERLRSQEICCEACEWPEPVDAGDDPYITWRKASMEHVYASGVTWGTAYRVALTLWSANVDRTDCDEVTTALLEKLLKAFDLRGGAQQPSCYVSSANMQGDYIAQVGRRAYDLGIVITEVL